MEIRVSSNRAWPKAVSVFCGLVILVSMGVVLASCGGGASFPPQSPRQLTALTVHPNNANAVAPGGTVSFSATGTFNQAPITQTNLSTQ
jgi:hypothetical protein